MVVNDEPYDDNSSPDFNYLEQYKEMKRKLRLLIYENEIFQQTLKKTQRKMLKASRDKSVLLERLLQYERVEISSSDDELTESSDEGECNKPEPKKRREGPSVNASGSIKQSVSPQTTSTSQPKKRKPSTPKTSKSMPMQLPQNELTLTTPENCAKQLLDQKPATNNFALHNLRTDLSQFPENFSVKTESNGIFDMDTSPNHVSEDMISVDSITK
ncbi:INO80 complex subunit E [Adelges cooleyi]|uniref:INO80 complex subunit E n=1 Tax=Adelges cooleyi TaxID=133065 RepID=UPI00217FDCDF|nr:INO80 complex subunit E [Adelges cooleyi]